MSHDALVLAVGVALGAAALFGWMFVRSTRDGAVRRSSAELLHRRRPLKARRGFRIGEPRALGFGGGERVVDWQRMPARTSRLAGGCAHWGRFGISTQNQPRISPTLKPTARSTG